MAGISVSQWQYYKSDKSVHCSDVTSAAVENVTVL